MSSSRQVSHALAEIPLKSRHRQNLALGLPIGDHYNVNENSAPVYEVVMLIHHRKGAREENYQKYPCLYLCHLDQIMS